MRSKGKKLCTKNKRYLKLAILSLVAFTVRHANDSPVTP